MKRLLLIPIVALTALVAFGQAMRTYNGTNDLVSASHNPSSANTNAWVVDTNDFSYTQWTWWPDPTITNTAGPLYLESLRPGVSGSYVMVENLHWNRSPDLGGTNIIIWINNTNQGGLVGALTVPYLPRAIGTNKLADSHLYWVATGTGTDTNLYFGPGTTNFLRRIGNDVVLFASDSVGGIPGYFAVTNLTDPSMAYFGSGGNEALVRGKSGVGLVDALITGRELRWGNNTFFPLQADTHLGIAPGNSGFLWGQVHASTNYDYGYRDITQTNDVRLRTSMSGTTGIFNIESKTNNVPGPITGFKLQTNGVDVASFGTGSDAVGNWTFPNATDASLVGTAKAGTLTGTNGVNIDRTLQTGGTIGGGGNNTGVGIRALNNLAGGINNTAFGLDCLNYLTTGSANALFGYDGFWASTNGTGNTGIGSQVGLYNESGGENTVGGCQTGYGVSGNSWSGNTLWGYQSGYNLTTGSYNSTLGRYSGFRLTAGSSNVFEGNCSGSYSTTESNEYFLNNRDLGSRATEITDSLMYGQFNPTVSSQTLRINGQVGIGNTPPTLGLFVEGHIGISTAQGYYIYNGAGNNSAGLTFPSARLQLEGYNGIIFCSSAASLGSQTERMRLLNNGNFGINTNAPSEKLEVSGNIKVSGSVTAGSFDVPLLSLGDVNTNLVIDFSTLGFRTGNLTNDSYITVTGMPSTVARTIEYVLYTGDTNRNLYWQVGLSNSMGAPLPSIVPSNNVINLTLRSIGTTVTNVHGWVTWRTP